MSEAKETSEEIELRQLRAARSRPAVLKLKLAKVRSQFNETPIIILEGDDDKIVYSQWIRRVRPGLCYVFHVSGGKSESIALKVILDNDVTNLKENVYLIVDRDYDGFRGIQLNDAVFITDRYSVENYLATEQVLEETLRIEFHCHAAPQIVEVLMAAYRNSFREFCDIVGGVNFEIFCGAKSSTSNQ